MATNVDPHRDPGARPEPQTLGKHLTELAVGLPFRGCVEDFNKSVVSGWCLNTSHPALGVAIEVLLFGIPIGTTRTSRTRKDVNSAVGFGVPASLTFDLTSVSVDSARKVLAALAACAPGELMMRDVLQVRVATTALTLPFSNALARRAVAREELRRLLDAQLTATRTVTSTPAPYSEAARAWLEGVSACERTGEALVWGWIAHTPGVTPLLFDEAGNEHALNASVRWYRRDVHETVANEIPYGSMEAGFVARVSGITPGQTVRLIARSASGDRVLGQTVAAPLPVAPVDAARLLFGIASPMSDFHRRLGLVDGPVLDTRIAESQHHWAELPVVERQLGSAPVAPVVTIVVPLFATAKFVDHQLMEFARDPGFAERVDLVYVIDDPRLVEPFAAEAEMLHRIYRLPFRWIWGGANRGFAGANNLGAARARADRLILLNSDAFPKHAGWTQAMLAVLEARPDIGAVGPRLLFADGSLQHAGMRFLRLEEYGIWANHHPHAGLDPALDPHRELTIVPAVTGACMALRRSDFERVGGLDTGYLVGDFEDSDLCLKFRAQGLLSAYLPTVTLTHLERQSFKTLGQDEFRTRVVFFNAVRHQRRWARELSELANEDPRS